MPLTVYKWDGYLGFSRGHVSIALSDGTYISWWPEGRTKKIFCKPVVAKEHVHTTLQSDTAQFHRKPDICIQLDTTLEHDKQIKDWWTVLRAESRYDLFFHNCATVVYKALQTCYDVKALYTLKEVCTPDDIENISKIIYQNEVPLIELDATETKQAGFSDSIKSYVEVLKRSGSEYQSLEVETEPKKSLKSVLKRMCCCYWFGPRKMCVLRQP
ncbi:uncharacterized protein LOC127863646 [Dreissena polymorpha]|uniref:Uncharacterized protein n=1 Tax=Dreissena polymorpha TaxID=45954 RepID=A0A9D4BEZ7_DREPO|nr:uncharacterized protein LOC127863646 [Dreissena polymorpha]KAH3691302.1 hypothetical protein DPMN_192353 [Dreissena polymorpha]